MDINRALEEFGLSPSEVKIYLALVTTPGIQPASTIARKLGMKRTTVYKSLIIIANKGLVTKTMRHSITCFVAEKPEERLKALLEKKQDRIKEASKVISDVIPELASGDHREAIMPKIRYYEGIEGVKQIYDVVLKAGEDYNLYGNIHKIYKLLGPYMDKYVAERDKSNVKVKVIMPQYKDRKNAAIASYNKNVERHFIPYELFDIDGEIRIMKSKVCIVSLVKGELIGVIIESPSLAKNVQLHFPAHLE